MSTDRIVVGVGVHSLDVEDYYADPAPEPSLSSSGIKVLLEQTPAHFRAQHPRLTEWPDYARPSTPAQDRGSVVHSLLLGAGRPVQVIDGYDDWRKKDARAKRDESKAAGYLPVLRKSYDEAKVIADHAEVALRQEFGVWPIGDSEQTMVWQRSTAHGPIYCRALDDHLAIDRGLIVDVKTTEESIADAKLWAKIANDGADIQNAHYLEGLESVHPDLAGRTHFKFAYVEVNPPYLVRIVELPTRWITLVAQVVDSAADLFAQCLRTNTWPKWKVASPQIPVWHEQRLMERLIAESRGVVV